MWDSNYKAEWVFPEELHIIVIIVGVTWMFPARVHVCVHIPSAPLLRNDYYCKHDYDMIIYYFINKIKSSTLYFVNFAANV